MSTREVGFIDTKKLARYLEDAWLKSAKERKIFNCWDGKFTKPVTKNYKISICTTVMNRLGDLKQTLPKNMEDNSDYPNLEFVILDYNSIDGLGDWIKSEMAEHIESGLVVYYRTEEPKYFDMSHSRNVAFKVASGEIVNNVDADNFTLEGFALYINRLANEQPRRAMFPKSRQLLRGRLGFYKDEFIEILGGYSETLKFYGHDDANLIHRAFEMGFRSMAFRKFSGIIPNHKKHQEGNYPEEWWKSEGRNRLISFTDLIVGNFTPNKGKEWGKAKLVKNFKEEVEV